MMNVIIVEDENIVRIGLSALINWEECGFHLAGLFKNGKEAMDYIVSNDVDIVLTDICMPVMDGEELVRKIREYSGTISIVVLSNFDDFEIVKNCFKMDIADYILKQDIEADKLQELLKSIVDKRKVQAARETDISEAQRRQLFFSELQDLDFQLSDSGIRQKYQNLLMSLQDRSFLVAEIILIHRLDGKLYYGRGAQSLAVREGIRESGSNYFEGVEILSGGAKYRVVFWDSDEVSCEGKIALWVERAVSMMREYFNLEMKIGVSGAGFSINSLKTACREAAFGRWHLFYYPDKIYLQYRGGMPGFCEDNSFFECLKEVKLCFEFNNFSVLKASLENFYFTLKKDKNLRPRSVCRFTFEILREVDYFLLETFQEESQKIRLADIEPGWEEAGNVYYFSIDSLKEYLFSVIEKVVNYLRTYEKHYELIAKAKLLISKRYKEDLSLQDMADVLNVNPAYFSTLFKKKTGVSFVQYLTNYRIKKAMNLLRTTGSSVEEISERVGYPNANYFVKVFKKTVGMNVSEFKRNGT